MELQSDNERHYFGTVSALCLLENNLLIGNGNILKILDYKNSKYIYSNILFTQSKITKIKTFDYKQTTIIIIIAETEIKYLLYNKHDFIYNNPITIPNTTQDYIVDAYIVEDNLILGFVNNYIDIFKFDTNESSQSLNVNFIRREFCPEKCIVYSMNIITYTTSPEDIIIASGTVFRNIIIWKIKLSEINSKYTLLKLKGHEGVVFNLYFADLNNLLSVSDDRTAKHWIINYVDLTYDVTTYYGHSARIWDGKLDLTNNILVTVSEDCTGRVYDVKTKKLLKELAGTHLGKNIRCVEKNDRYIFTAGEDWQIVKWDITKMEDENINKANDNCVLKDSVHNFPLPDDNNCRIAREKQKNFSPAVKILKFVKIDMLDYIMIGTNHGEVMLLDVTSKFTTDLDVNKSHLVFSDSKLRVINSLDLIQNNETYTLIVGLSDGWVGIITLSNFNKTQNTVPPSTEVKIFNNIRISYIFHKFINEDNILLMISTPLGSNKIYLIQSNKLLKIEETLNDYYNNNSAIVTTGSKYPMPICSAEVLKLDNKRGEYVIFLGDFNGNLYFTHLKKIGIRFFAYNDVKYLKIHSDDKITNINLYPDENLLYTCGRDGKLKKFLFHISNAKNNFSINEVESKTRTDISSFEYLHKKDDEFIIVGHHGREILLMDYNKNTIFYSKDIKGCNRAFDILFKKDGDIIFAFSENRITTLVNINYTPMNSEMKVVNYNTPLHGRLIHSNLLVYLSNGLSLLITASEDTKINFYTFENKNISKLKFIDQFTRHGGAIRNVHIIDKLIEIIDGDNKIISLIFSSVGAGSESFVFKLKIFITNDELIKHSLFFLCDLTKKEKNLDTRNMSCDSIKISQTERKYLLTICNTLGNYFIFYFNFDKNEFKYEQFIASALKNTSFIPLCVKFLQVQTHEKNEKNKYIIFGLTNGIVYIKKLNSIPDFQQEINSLENDKQYKIHEAGINDLQLYGQYVFTCGEDNSVVISFIKNDGELEINRKIFSLHSSPIKSINIFNRGVQLILISAGYDQNVNIMNILLKDSEQNNHSTKLVECNLLEKITASCAEINSSAVIKNNHTLIISVAGQGIELFKISLSK